MSQAQPGSTEPGLVRDLHRLPKAHLHLHFTGSMRHSTLLELAARDGIALPDQLAAAPPARAALRRWRAESEQLLRNAATGALLTAEPPGYVADTGEPDRFEQPPGVRR